MKLKYKNKYLKSFCYVLSLSSKSFPQGTNKNAHRRTCTYVCVRLFRAVLG